ncbi:hypothetical protein GJ744_000981 [Endocarpon pusillum]|uniref:Major facilitator superfamily (MFS) profile domain-containing protein n=1 Tax=Endocarpon pusillum TaxID=364733 RepID=A0A8H7E1J3_9EURO|nr:hypothetical protein GJ744_000981 [Endocarpon pusillum]
MAVPTGGIEENAPLLHNELGPETQGKLREIEKTTSTWRLVAGIGFTWLASWLSALDSTITITLSSTIAADFHSLALISWLGSAYLIALASTQPMSGKLTDVFGRRSGFIFCLVLFGCGNLICGLATTKAMIVLGRVVTGIGGGGINSISTFIASDFIPPRRRGMWHGIAMVVYASGSGFGGVFGGLINEIWGWRSPFLALTPLTVLSGLGVTLFLPPRVKETSLRSRLGRVDFVGSATLVLALALLLVGLNQEDLDAVSSHYRLEILLPLAAAAFIAFVVVELYYAQEPVISINLLKNRTILGACITSWFTSMSLYSLVFYVPLYFQLRGANTSETGVRLLPEPVGGVLGSFSSGIIMRLTGRYGVLKIVVLATWVAGATGFATISMNSSQALPELYLFLVGFGQGGNLTVMLLALLSSVKHEQQAVTTSINYAFRSTGAMLGITVTSVMFRKLLTNQFENVAVPPGFDSRIRTDGLGDVLRGCKHPEQATQKYCGHLADGYMHALHGTFLLAMSLAIAGFSAGMVTKNYQLWTRFEDDEAAHATRIRRDNSSSYIFED